MKTPILKAHEVAERYRAKRRAKTLAKEPGQAQASAAPLFAKAADGSGELFFYNVIGQSWDGSGITGDSVADALKQLGDVKTLNLYINSEGGDVWQAKAIYAQLLRHPATKNVYVDGLAASAASFIAMAGDHIVTAKAGTWMVHEAECLAYGRADYLETMAGMVRKENEAIAGIYAEQTGGTVDEMLELMSATTWMNADEALKKGFTDEVKDPDEDDDDDEDGDMKDAASKSKLVAIALSTEQRVRHLVQQRRLEQLSARASPEPRSGKPQRTTPSSPKKDPQ